MFGSVQIIILFMMTIWTLPYLHTHIYTHTHTHNYFVMTSLPHNNKVEG